MSKPKRMFSGNYSKPMWNDINSAKNVKNLQRALYFVCCRHQELEAKIAQEHKGLRTPKLK